MTTTTKVKARCACGTFKLEVGFPNTSLPFDRALCLCNICRSTTGTCANSGLTLPSYQSIDPADYKLSFYRSSEPTKRYFCTTCGAHVLSFYIPSGIWILCTGLWDRTDGLIRWTGCKWVKDTLDGGVSIWFKDIVDADGQKRELKRWMGYDKGKGDVTFVPEGAFTTMPVQTGAVVDNERLEAKCHCGGIKFYITRPNEASKKVQSPFPDLMRPYHSMPSANPGNETWWLRGNGAKYLAGTCTCTSCRLSSGCEIQSWAFVPRCNIFQEDGTLLDFNSGTLKSYASSKGVWRKFCSICGATAFWHCDERPELIDIGTGLLDPKQGARAEAWLDWYTDRVSFEELSVSKSLTSSLEAGLRGWKAGI